MKDSIKKVRDSGKKVIVALPRILKPFEDGMTSSFHSLSEDILIRNTGHIEALAQANGEETLPKRHNLYGDFSLNVANSLAASKMLEQSQIVRFAPSHDLNANQISSLARSLGDSSSSKMECIIHHHLPIFHTEHCVFCRFLSDGTSKKDCGAPCEDHSVHLRDHMGNDHLVLADQILYHFDCVFVGVHVASLLF